MRMRMRMSELSGGLTGGGLLDGGEGVRWRKGGELVKWGVWLQGKERRGGSDVNEICERGDLRG